MRPAKRARNIVLALLGVLGVSLGVAGVVLAAPSKPTLTLGISPASQSIQQGQTASYKVTATGANGFAGSVAFTVSGLPSGATASFSPSSVSLTSSITQGTSTLTVVTAKSTPAASSTLTITGTSGSTKSTVTATLTVTAALNGSFTLAQAPSSVSVAPGTTAVYTLTLTRTAPFTGAVTLGAFGSWPTGAAASFSPNPIPSTGSTSTLQVATTSATPDGTYTLYVVGSYKDPSTGQTTYQYAHADLVVDSKLSSKPFSISGGAPARSLAPGVDNQPLNLAITNPNNQTLPVTNLSVSVTSTSNAGCTPGNFAVTQYSGPYPLNVPANANAVTLTALGIPPSQQPQLKMIDLNTKQDACKGVTVNLSYSGSAQGN
jgi:hypothetical protein